jgi:hypothetical protein
MSVHSAYYLKAAGMMGGEMIVVVKCRGEEAGNMLIISIKSTHNNHGTLVNMDDDAHRCCLGKGKARLMIVKFYCFEYTEKTNQVDSDWLTT